MKKARLGDVAPAKASAANFKQGEVVWQLGLDMVESGTGSIIEKKRELLPDKLGSVAAFDSEHVLYSKLRPYLNKVVLPDESGLATTELVPMRPDPDLISREFLAHYLRSPRFVNWAEQNSSGAKMPRVTMSSLWEHEIPLPPLAEQRRIAEILDKADELKAKRQQAIDELDKLQQAVFLDMFGDPASNPKKFPMRLLIDFQEAGGAGTKCGPFGSALKKSEYVAAGVPVWNMDNIDPRGVPSLPFRQFVSENKYMQLLAYSVVDGDILISRAGTVGKMCVARGLEAPSILSTNLIRLRLGESLLPEFFVSLMTFCKGRVGRLKVGADGAFTHMNTKVLDELKFPYPPLTLQREFLNKQRDIEKTRSIFLKSADAAAGLCSSLQSRAFTGEL